MNLKKYIIRLAAPTTKPKNGGHEVVNCSLKFVTRWNNVAFPPPVWLLANTTILLYLLLVRLLAFCLFSVSMEKARIIPPVDFHLTERGLAFELSLSEASSQSRAVQEARAAKTYGVSCKEGDVRDREKRKN